MRLPDYASAQSDTWLIMYKLEPGNSSHLHRTTRIRWDFDAEIIEKVELPSDIDIAMEWGLDICHTHGNQKYYYIKEN